jgi:hypothetical protein
VTKSGEAFCSSSFFCTFVAMSGGRISSRVYVYRQTDIQIKYLAWLGLVNFKLNKLF